jgi:hypothetical protein
MLVGKIAQLLPEELATKESKRRAGENLVREKGPRDESVTSEKGRVAALP